jgi:diguanylate cyclase (GGDEF)-like protein
MALIELRATQRELQARIESLDRLARQDPLTGLLNRRALMEALEGELARALRYGGELSLVLLDVDHFKSINDRFGHSAGDEVLRRLGDVLGHSVRCVDAVGRYGGEEFMLVLPQTPLRGAQVFAEALRLRIAQVVFESVPETVTVSVGIAGLDPNAGSAKALIDAADRALYRAKRSGRNRVVAAVTAVVA